MGARRWMLAAIGAGLGCGDEPPSPDPQATQGTTADAGSTSIDVSSGGDPSTGVDDSTSSEPSSTTTSPPAECGNGAIEDGEECDGTNLGGVTCDGMGLEPGELACGADCMLDVSGCGSSGMVLVPAGSFEMGSDDDLDEQPVRQVNVDAFYIDETEVTVTEYTACVTAGACSTPTTGMYYNYGVAGRENHPINGVDWFGAEAYCAWEGGKRLPTEAEWEKAARGTDARMYPWGNTPGPSCTHVVMDEGGNGCGLDSTWEVGQKPLGASPYGALDLCGNIWEWVSDWYGSYDPEALDNPTGPAMGTARIVRGGPWYSNSVSYFRAADRQQTVPTVADFTLGFRCAMTAPR